MTTVTLAAGSLDAMRAHARATYPDECCGFVIERLGGEEVVPVTNIQNELHARDPHQYPRTAATAYTMGREQVAVIDGVERGQLVLRAIYHSHPEHDAYFSAEDRKQAVGPWGEPNYPQAAQIVLSVRGGAVAAVKAFAWDLVAGDYVEADLGVGPA
ncbi:M67 family metallopeptidase [Candidatus Binatia bacterium]|nr:M67 family metallopeptidase [Candidatus Binatia bacterium]